MERKTNRRIYNAKIFIKLANKRLCCVIKKLTLIRNTPSGAERLPEHAMKMSSSPILEGTWTSILSITKNEGKIGRLVWLVAVFGFANIFKEKFKQKYRISAGDMLFENCIHLKEHKRGPIPSFDVDKFLKEYRSEVRDYYYRPWRRKIWQKEVNMPSKMKISK